MMMPSNSFFSASVLALAAGAAAKSVSTTPHDKYSSSVGVLGCKIDTNRVAYWPGSVDCDNFCVKVSMGSRSVHLLHIDQSQGAYDISYDAWVYLQTGKSATKKPISGGGVAMEYEYVDASECAHLFKTDGAKVPLSASNSMNFLASCLEQPSSYIAKNHELYNICDAICSMGTDEKCKLDLAVSNQPSCGSTLGLTTALTSAPVWDIQFSTGKKVLAGGGDGAPVYAGPGDDDEEEEEEEEDDSNNNPGYTAPEVSKPAPAPKPKPSTEAYVAPKPTTEAYVAPEPTTEAYVAPEPTTEAYVAPEPTTEPYVAPEPTTTEAVVVPEPTYEEPAAPEPTTTSKAHSHKHKHGHGHKHTKAKAKPTSTVDDHVFQEVPSSSTEPEAEATTTTKAKKVQATSAVYSAPTSIVSSVTAASTPESTPGAPTVVPANAGERGAQVSFGVLASAAVLVVCSLVM